MGVALMVLMGQNATVMLTGDQIRAGRVHVGWSQGDLAEKVDTGRDTIARAESAGPDVPRFLKSGTMLEIVRAFEAAGWSFYVDGSLASGVRMEHPTLKPAIKSGAAGA